MNIVHRLFAALCLLAASSMAAAAGMATCTGKFPNPLTDICWSCLLPITIGTHWICYERVFGIREIDEAGQAG